MVPVDKMYFSDVDGRSSDEVLGTWGGDLGELLVGLAVVEDKSGPQIQPMIDQYVGKFLSSSAAHFFYMMTDTLVRPRCLPALPCCWPLTRCVLLCCRPGCGLRAREARRRGAGPHSAAAVHACAWPAVAAARSCRRRHPPTRPPRPIMHAQARVLELFTHSEAHGCAFIRKLLENPAAFSVRREMVTGVLQALFKRMWDPRDVRGARAALCARYPAGADSNHSRLVYFSYCGALRCLFPGTWPQD